MDRRKWEWTPSILRQARTISSREPLVNIDEKYFEALLRHRMCHMGFITHLQKSGDPRIDIAKWQDGGIKIQRIDVGADYESIPDHRDIVAFFPDGDYGRDNRYVMQLKVGAAPYPKNKGWPETYKAGKGTSDLRRNLQELSEPDSGVDAVAFCSDELFYLHASEGGWHRKGTKGAARNHLGTNNGDPNEGLFPTYETLIAQPGRIVHFTGLWDDPCHDHRRQDPVTLHGVAVAVRVTGLKPCTLQNLTYLHEHLYALEHEHDTDDNDDPKYRCSQCDHHAAEGMGMARSTIKKHWTQEHHSHYPPEYRTRGNIYRISVILGSEPENCPVCYPLEEE